MKISVSISEKIGHLLQQLADKQDTNASTVVESALRCFAALPERDRRRAIVETQASKRSLSSSGWRSVFWTVLADEFEAVDFDRGSGNRVMAMRTYRGFHINFLMNDIRNSNPDALIVHVWAAGSRTHFVGTTTEYQLEDSVYEAARSTATWIREHQHLLAEKPADAVGA